MYGAFNCCSDAFIMQRDIGASNDATGLVSASKSMGCYLECNCTSYVGTIMQYIQSLSLAVGTVVV